jgi:S-DNA-T family DNA segregation ATPase FtsK/SpoIIIE
MATEVEKKTTSQSHSLTNEIVAISLLAATILIFLCLVSFNENDPSLITESSFKTQNWIGVVGANVAAILFSIIGLTAYLIPVLMGLIAWRIFRSASLYAPVGRIIGYVLFVLSFSSLLFLVFSSGFRGGMLGALIAGGLLALIGKIGAMILLITLFLASILLITNLSYIAALGGFQMAFDNFKIHFDGWFSRYRTWREEEELKVQERLEKRKANERTEKESQPKELKNPTISTGDIAATKTTPVADEKVTKLKEEKVPKPIEKIILEIDESEDFLEIEPVQAKRIEDLRPKIIFGEEEPSPNAVTEELPPILTEEVEKIPITPIKETGDLEKVELKDFNEFEMPEVEVETTPEPLQPPNWDDYILPTSDFLTPSPPRIEQKEEEFFSVAQELTEKSSEFNVTGRVMHICQGPVVTTYEFKPDPGVKYSRITGLADDLCLALKAESIRIDRIPGKAYVGIEVPNQKRETIFLREVIESKKFKDSASLLSIALGKSIDGLNYVADLTKMPHLLMAGQTGAGKSVGINSLIVSILYKAKPDEVKLIMVDPKQVELGVYADIPHLATPIIKDPKRASVALKWAVGQMEKRYKDLAAWGVRNIDGYNAEVKRRNEDEEFDDNGDPWKKLPYLVIIIDELADLMMVAGKEVEESITRLAQMARAVGIHLVLATQRPSVDVITGLIKANFPSRISFRVSSKVDSRTIIDANGAESLLGRGDMLFLPPGTSNLVRVHGAFVDEKEIMKIVDHIKAQGKPDYDVTITKTAEELEDTGELPGKKDPLFLDALRSVVGAKRASTSLLQRHLRIGYGRAAAILDAMVREEFIGEMDGSTRARPILEKAYEFLEGYDSVKKDGDN